MIAENLKSVRSQIDGICAKCGRRPEELTLVAVSKTFSAGLIQEAVIAGQFDFGENYVQELTGKNAGLPDPEINWHFIGHLQSNKVRAVVPFVRLIHAVDTIGLAREIEKRAAQIDRHIDILIEVHTTDEATKFGVRPEAVADLASAIGQLSRVHVRGLMTMGPFSDDPEDSRPSFRTVAELSREIARHGIENVTMDQLSMGMSHDFQPAIEEGATILRIGTAIFGKRVQKSEE